LEWYTFATQDGFPVTGQSGLVNGLGIWVLLVGAYTTVNAIVLSVATSERAVRGAIWSLWFDVLLTGIALGIGVANLSGGNWVIVGTTTPLMASVGPGLDLLIIGTLVLLVATIRVTFVVGRQNWSWSD
jgi:hypothetical protein